MKGVLNSKSVGTKLMDVSERFDELLEGLLCKTLDDLLDNLDKIGAVKTPKKRTVKKNPATKISE